METEVGRSANVSGKVIIVLSNEEKDRITQEIGKLFEGLEISDVASVMTVQLAMLAAQGGTMLDEAIGFLDEIRDDAEDVLETLDFDEVAEEKADGDEAGDVKGAFDETKN